MPYGRILQSFNTGTHLREGNIPMSVKMSIPHINRVRLRLRKDTSRCDLKYLVNYVYYQSSVCNIEFDSSDYPPDKI